jgi:hypothetical protein
MRKRNRLALVAAVGALALAFSGTALASFAPKITVQAAPAAAGSSGGVQVNAAAGANDDPTARVVIYVPSGYQLGSPAVGTRLGGVTASAQAADLGGAILPLTGDLLVVNPTQFATQQAQCGVATAAQTWDLHLTAAGQTLDVPVYVIQTAGTETAIGQFKLQICLPPPDVPAGTPGRAAFGAKLLTAVFDSNAFTNPSAAGEYRWRALWTPYTPRTGQVNAAGSVETQSIVRVPTQVSVAAKKKVTAKKVKVRGKLRTLHTTTATVTATVTENATPVSGAKVTITMNGKTIKTGTTGAAGTLTVTVKVTGKKTFAAKATLDERDLGAAGCTNPVFGVPCADATVGGAALTGRNTVSVTAAKP